MIRNRLKEFREMQGWTQGELAERAGVSLPIVVRLETVEGYAPMLDTVERICRVFNKLPIERMFWIDYAASRDEVAV
jgi:putative transcriptional regulator